MSRENSEVITLPPLLGDCPENDTSLEISRSSQSSDNPPTTAAHMFDSTHGSLHDSLSDLEGHDISRSRILDSIILDATEKLFSVEMLGGGDGCMAELNEMYPTGEAGEDEIIEIHDGDFALVLRPSNSKDKIIRDRLCLSKGASQVPVASWMTLQNDAERDKAMLDIETQFSSQEKPVENDIEVGGAPANVIASK